MRRRTFLRQISATGLMIGSGLSPALALGTPETVSLTILHTNDWHSRIEPFPQDGGRNAGMGGAVRRARKIANLRKELEHVLLLDAGDIFQGTPYFNLYNGELEFKLMTEMGYDVTTIGNHDFDGGIENLALQFDQHASFGLVNSNYRLEDTPLAGKVRPYQIIEKGPLRIGILGVGIELEGLVPASLTGAATYTDPIAAANKTAAHLKLEEKCDLVVCLSHLGYRYQEEKVSDLVLAAESRNIDLILGGHTHTFLDEPVVVNNRDQQGVLVHQVGWAGILLGRIDVSFDQRRGKRCFNCANEWLA
ncbi:bifunctional UDP-sugar hydrolase/5'-nucleotidase [Lewinella sp. LCG006]|uniref:bifunctional metallophosphatase/5'-nucleotidase n=1 Tax=Lewinella sp. LCG006 TaxID=3231911 RepID=UPI0034608C32